MKVKCACGHVIRDQTDYLAYKAQLLRDEDDARFWDAVQAVLAEGPEHADDRDTRLALLRPWLAHTTVAYECEACGRLYLERAPGAEPLVAFVPESGKPERILASMPGLPVGQPGELDPPAG